MSHHDHHHDNSHNHHITPLWVYWAVAGALFTLTGVTVGVAHFDFNHLTGIPQMNLIIAMIVATIKGSLVCLIFMHLWFDNKLYSFAFLSGLGALAIFIVLTLFDTERRADIYDITAHPILPQVEYKEPAHHEDGDGTAPRLHEQKVLETAPVLKDPETKRQKRQPKFDQVSPAAEPTAAAPSSTH